MLSVSGYIGEMHCCHQWKTMAWLSIFLEFMLSLHLCKKRCDMLPPVCREFWSSSTSLSLCTAISARTRPPYAFRLLKRETSLLEVCCCWWAWIWMVILNEIPAHTNTSQPIRCPFSPCPLKNVQYWLERMLCPVTFCPVSHLHCRGRQNISQQRILCEWNTI